jgi:hypothetical protein
VVRDPHASRKHLSERAEQILHPWRRQSRRANAQNLRERVDKLAAAHGLVIDDIIGTRTRDQRAHDGSGSVVV